MGDEMVIIDREGGEVNYYPETQPQNGHEAIAYLERSGMLDEGFGKQIRRFIFLRKYTSDELIRIGDAFVRLGKTFRKNGYDQKAKHNLNEFMNNHGSDSQFDTYTDS